MKLTGSIKKLIKGLQPTPPVDILGIAKILGLNVWEKRESSNIAGKLFVDAKHGGPCGYSILIRAQDPFMKKRFTVAHEISHYLLHRDIFRYEISDDAEYKSFLSDHLETQANTLAAELLVPFHLIFQIDNINVTRMSELFQVPVPFIVARLAML